MMILYLYFQYFCYALIGSLQLFVVSFFGWTFAESIHLYFTTRMLIEKNQKHLVLFYFIGWGKCLMNTV